MSFEYTNAGPQMPGSCAYASLGGYNAPSAMNIPVPPTTRSGYYLIPSYASPSYNTLSDYGNPCSGYPDILHAYKTGVAANCGASYSVSLCGNAPGTSASSQNMCGSGGSGCGRR